MGWEGGQERTWAGEGSAKDWQGEECEREWWLEEGTASENE